MYALLAICMVTATIPGVDGVVSCRAHSDCNQKAGEVCLQRFYGCQVGTCLCPDGQDKDNKGTCQKRKIGNEHCEHDDVCSGGMPCEDGRCHCDGQLSPDRTFCLRPNQRLLGNKCSDDTICLQQIGSRYTRNHVVCKNGACSCTPGFKQAGVACQKWEIEESGCLEHDQCHGGALCNDRKCQCPPGYNIRAGGTKCTRKNALVDLDVGQTCNEVDELKYCGENLICHVCEGLHKCLQSRNNPHSALSSSSTGIHQMAWRCSVLTLFITYMYTHIINRR